MLINRLYWYCIFEIVLLYREFYKRTVEDVTNMLTLAKQNEHEVIPITQVFYLPSEEEFSNTMENMKLLSIDEEFIKKLEDGER